MVGAAAGKIDQHVGHVDKGRGLGGSHRRLFLPVAAEKEIGAGPAAAEHQKRRAGNNDQLQR